MKRYTSKLKFKYWNKYHAAKLHLRSLNSKAKKRKKNQSYIGLSQFRSSYKKKYIDPFRDFIHVKAPSHLSFIHNTDEVISFISKLKALWESERKVFVVLKDVIHIDYDAIVVLLSIMIRFKAKGIQFNGDLPSNQVAKELLMASGFFKRLSNRIIPDSDRYNVEGSHAIHTHAWKKVDSELGKELMENYSLSIWGVKRRCQGCQRTLIELMLNTNNHASIGKEGDKHWWLSVHYRKEEKIVSFSFVDFGVGVFTSLDNKTEGSKFHGWMQKLKRRIQYGTRTELMKLLLNGDVHLEVTGKEHRGKGLPGIVSACRENKISNLHIITNNVSANVSNNDFRILHNNFNGTFVYWELHESNTNYPWILEP